MKLKYLQLVPFFFIVFFLTLSNLLGAQENVEKTDEYKFGLRGGLNFHHTYGSTAGNDIGYVVGYTAISKKMKLFRWQFAVQYIEHGSKRTTISSTSGEEITSTINRNYIAVPLSININLFKIIDIHAGGYIGSTVKKNLIFESASLGRDEYELVDSSKLDAGLFGGINIFLTKKIGLSADYYHGSFNTYEGFDQSFIAKNRSVAITLNYYL